METIDRDTILRRAIKLAAINGTNSTTEEAMLAAERLAAMLRDNNMSMKDVDSAKIKKGIRRENVLDDSENRRKWVGWLSSSIAGACDCKVIVFNQGTHHLYSFIGYEEDAIVAAWFFSRIRDILPGICALHMKQWKKSVLSMYAQAGYHSSELKLMQTAQKNGFMAGFSSRISTKIRNVIKPEVQTEENKNQFAIIDLKAAVVKEKFQEMFPDCKNIKENQQFSETGAEAGITAAENTSVNVPLAENLNQKALTTDEKKEDNRWCNCPDCGSTARPYLG